MAFHYYLKDLYKGNNNRVKARVLFYLNKCGYSVTARELSAIANVSIEYLKRRLPQFASWKPPYVLRRHKDGFYRYRISTRGIRFVNEFIPDDLLNELNKEFTRRFNR